MDNEEFRRRAHELVDWVADYVATVEERPVRSKVAPGEVRAGLPATPPTQPEPFDRIMADLNDIVMPGITHWRHPRFFAYFPANTTPPSVLAEMLISGMGAQCMLWQTSPAATEMETHLVDWLRQAIGLPPEFQGVIQDSASSATLCALLTAREQATGWESNESGLRDCPPLAVYASAESHSSIEKAVKIAGFGRKNIRLIEVDDQRRMRADRLREAIRHDREAGVRPACVIATLGSTGIGTVDDLAAIGPVCAEEGVFLHVDAAWAGSALILPECRWMIEGIEHADSFCFNPHKWLGMQFDCSVQLLRDPDALVRTFSILPAYLRGRETGEVIDYRDWGIPLGRRFRALKIWLVLRCYGLEGLQNMLRQHIAWTEELAGWIEADPGFELTSPANLAVLSFRHVRPGLDEESANRLNQSLVDALNDDGRVYLTPNRIDDRLVIRVSIGAYLTEHRHVEEAWEVIREMAAVIEA